MAKLIAQAALDVIQRFNDVADNNSVDYNSLVLEMEADVVLKRVLNPNSVKGIGDASGYLNAHMRPLKPALRNPVNQPPWFPGGGTNNTSTYGQVTGTGNYYDQTTTPPLTPTPVTFTLSFVRNSTGDDWSLINSFAAPK